MFLRGCTCTSVAPFEEDGPPPPPDNFSFSFEKGRSSVREVEKCFEEGARDRVGVAWG